MLDHINIPVTNLVRSAQFFRLTLPVLEMNVLYEDADAVGFGHEKWDFGVVLEQATIPCVHVAFAANSQQTVWLFHKTVLS